jgi:hypothetical protein
MTTDVAQMRIECLKLAHRLDLPPEMVVDRAKVYEQYIFGAAQAEMPDNRSPKRPGGQSGKTDKR